MGWARVLMRLVPSTVALGLMGACGETLSLGASEESPDAAAADGAMPDAAAPPDTGAGAGLDASAADGPAGPCPAPDASGPFAFVTSGTFLGNQAGGGAGPKLDQLCTAIANDAGLAGTFTAYVRIQPNPPYFRLARASWVRPDGLPLFTESNQPPKPPVTKLAMTEHCKVLDDNAGVWTGQPAAAVSENCADWSSATKMGDFGDPQTFDRWQSASRSTCDVLRHFYCFQQ